MPSPQPIVHLNPVGDASVSVNPQNNPMITMGSASPSQSPTQAGSSVPVPVVGVAVNNMARVDIVEMENFLDGRCSLCGGNHNIAVGQRRDPWDYVAPYFGSPDFYQGFYSIPAVEGEVRPQEVMHFALMKFVRGDATGWDIEHEFQVYATELEILC